MSDEEIKWFYFSDYGNKINIDIMSHLYDIDQLLCEQQQPDTTMIQGEQAWLVTTVSTNHQASGR